ncbi:enoyl-CoA hydratase/isomerase family protein [Brevibacterium sp. RIT 803]|uniref:enoyl-CoA hydratase/isomerase family protein n=1 Tax=Brevibacterium sp. RIT 803 TaxID=2810210 RepID=UPI00194FEA01|nr:enoyl-CoA hydratase/isomerase family protein [Brevibacterium sp. RIT 803]MBM6588872.1 enoyl-CoA hydratase/isomerase family protein [Brevibacterium sp. RIT 803]
MIETTTPPVAVHSDGVVYRVILDRPEKRNSLNADLVEALIGAVGYAREEGARLIVFQGEGKSFSAGFDFTDLSNQSDAVLAHRFLRLETLLQDVASAEIPTLAMAHGPTFGAGADLFAACDTRIVAPDSTFRFPGLRFDVVLGTRRIIDRIGTESARSVLAEGRTITADEAFAMGLATKIADRDDWPGVVDTALDQASSLSPEAAASLSRALSVGDFDADFADLARSVATPGLQMRIKNYVEGPR